MPAVLERESSAELEAALGVLRRIENRRREIVERDNAKFRLLQSFQREAQIVCARCDAAFSDDTDPDTFGKLLEGWAKNYALLRPLEQLVISQSRAGTGDPGRVGKLRSEFGDLRGPLIKVCELRIGQAKTELEHVTKEEQARLDLLGTYDATDSPPVKRAARRVEHLRLLLSRITSEPVENLWQNFVQQLLKDL